MSVHSYTCKYTHTHTYACTLTDIALLQENIAYVQKYRQTKAQTFIQTAEMTVVINPVYISCSCSRPHALICLRHVSLLQWGLGKGTNLTPPACHSGYCESNLQRPCGHFFTLLFSLGMHACWRQSLTWSFPHGIQLYWQFMASDWLKWPVTQVCHDWLIGIFVNLLDKV